ncbi:MAG TPA: tetratricopeptide repeat protein, partial [Myxococcales bacterium]|nr:tetratricopeptide repeat protein [Myxococcales bacterium]
APDSPRIRDVTEAFANIYFGLKRYRESLDAAERAVELNKKLEGPDSPELRFSLETMGKALVALNRPQDAIPVLEKALRYFESNKAPELDDLGDVRFTLARALRDARREPDRAIALGTRARDDYLAEKNPKKAEEVDRWLRTAPAAPGRRRNVLGSRD